MSKLRLIPRLDIKNDTIVKGIHLEGLRVVGKPEKAAQAYYENGADELLYIDAVASLYERNSLTDIIRKAAKKIFVPMTVGGGIRKIQDITDILNAGADKIAINTAGIKNPDFLKNAVKKFGSQCIVLSVQAKKQPDNTWEAYTETGRERTGKDVLEWIMQAINIGVGEILLTSVDKDGTKSGFDIELIRAVAPLCAVPLIVSGGAGRPEHLLEVLQIGNIDAIAIASALHYGLFSISEAKQYLVEHGIDVRI